LNGFINSNWEIFLKSWYLFGVNDEIGWVLIVWVIDKLHFLKLLPQVPTVETVGYDF
jgi:hypothetical protein